MVQPRLTITLVGSEENHGDVELSDFRRFCDSLTVCLRHVEAKFPEGATARLRYRIVDLSKGSASFTLEPIHPSRGPDFEDSVIALFAKTVGGLQSGKSINPRFGKDDLETFRRLAAPINRRVREIRIAKTQVTSRFIANIDELIGSTVPSEGSVKGRLERLNVHNKLECAIYPPIPGYSVKCVFTEDLYDAYTRHFARA